MLKVIGQTEEWLLIERPSSSTEEWINLKLICLSGIEHRLHKKRYIWQLGWNGERFARGSDYDWLTERVPLALPWVSLCLRERTPNGPSV